MKRATEENTHVGTVLFDERLNQRYLVIRINDKGYACLNGHDFEPIALGKKWISDYYNTEDDNDMSALRAGLAQK